MIIHQQHCNIIIVAYHRHTALNLSLQSLYKYTANPFKLTIINNSQTALDILSTQHKATHYCNQTNLGKAKGFMRWYQRLNIAEPYFIIADADIIYTRNWLDNLIASYHSHPNIGIVAPTINTTKRQLPFMTQYESKSFLMHQYHDSTSLINSDFCYNRRLAGPVMLINTNAFTKIGGFHTTRLYGHEDGELCHNMLKNNYLLGISTNSNIIHYIDDEPDGYRDWKRQAYQSTALTTGYWD